MSDWSKMMTEARHLKNWSGARVRGGRSKGSKAGGGYSRVDVFIKSIASHWLHSILGEKNSHKKNFSNWDLPITVTC